jgi:hypothetical protein
MSIPMPDVRSPRDLPAAAPGHRTAAAERAMRRHLEYLVQLVKALEERPDA